MNVCLCFSSYKAMLYLPLCCEQLDYLFLKHNACEQRDKCKYSVNIKLSSLKEPKKGKTILRVHFFKFDITTRGKSAPPFFFYSMQKSVIVRDPEMEGACFSVGKHSSLPNEWLEIFSQRLQALGLNPVTLFIIFFSFKCIQSIFLFFLLFF